MRDALTRLLDSPRVVLWAGAISLALGLFFTFVWAPHPWGWEGIDQYHELARALARGEPFGTTDVPWGYAYFVAALYALFGERPWLPVVVQVLANAAVPLLLYHLVQPLVGKRTAALASLLVGVFSFNTIYASIQASDAICTVLFIASLLSFARGYTTGRTSHFVLSGILTGLVPQFRPNMILFPFVMAATFVAIAPRSRRTLLHAFVFIAVVAAALAPWTIRNYRLTGMLLPTSTHGGVQLWYGTLQVGPYLESRAYNPRSAFEPSTFDYTSIAGQPIVIEADRRDCSTPGAAVTLVYWTDRDTRRITLAPSRTTSDQLAFEIPGQQTDTAVYYQFRAEPDGLETPASVFFVSADHLGDLDRHGDMLDIFDLVRLIRHVAWHDQLPYSPRLDMDRDGNTDIGDLIQLVVRLLGGRATADIVSGLAVGPDRSVLRLADGTELEVPRNFSGRITDLEIRGPLDRAIISAHRPINEPPPQPAGSHSCLPVGEVRVNDVFYRREPHQMRRYTSLAADNIRRAPVAFVTASAYRMFRLFVVRGAEDRLTAQQFAGSRLVYLAGLILSVSYLLVFAAGVVIAWKRHRPVLLLVIPIIYVPITICFVLTNMRYTITVQPLMFTFVALALVTAFGLDVPKAAHGRLSREPQPR
jgi:hypothetical protein